LNIWLNKIKIINPQKKDINLKEGDKVILNYSGSVDGEKFDGGTAEQAELVSWFQKHL
jgi:FKBP-type peptidyl-prolyl cis-trans isomerase (trigger factor)